MYMKSRANLIKGNNNVCLNLSSYQGLKMYMYVEECRVMRSPLGNCYIYLKETNPI